LGSLQGCGATRWFTVRDRRLLWFLLAIDWQFILHHRDLRVLVAGKGRSCASPTQEEAGDRKVKVKDKAGAVDGRGDERTGDDGWVEAEAVPHQGQDGLLSRRWTGNARLAGSRRM
jgi:hypothetical protein